MRTLITLAFAALGWLVGAAQAAEPAPAGVVQIFGCNLNEGQNADTVWATMDALRETAESQETTDPAFGMFLWQPYRGATDYDFAFGVLATDLNTMAAGSMSYAASSRFGEMSQRFQSLAGCDSAIMTLAQLSDGEVGMGGGDREVDAVVETFSCTINDGADMDDVNDVIEDWQSDVPKIGSEALGAYQAYLWTPFRGGTGSDFVWVGNAPDLATWAKGGQDYIDSSIGQSLDARFGAITQCMSQVWLGYWLVTPSEF